jgi:hypothetical protein
MTDYLYMWTIYRDPLDFPGKHVVRKFRVGGGGGAPEAAVAPTAVCGTIEEPRAAVPQGTVRLERSPTDDPCIVETWV